MSRHPTNRRRRIYHWSQKPTSLRDERGRLEQMQNEHIKDQRRKDAMILSLLGSSNPEEKNTYWVTTRIKPPRKPPAALGFRRGKKDGIWWRYADGALHAVSIQAALVECGCPDTWKSRVKKLSKTGEAVAESEGLQRLRRREFAEYREAMVVAPRVEGAALPEPRNGVPVEVKPGLSASPSRRIFSARRSL